MKTLLVTPHMRDISKSEKGCGTYNMKVFEFLNLTTDKPVFEWEAQEADDTQSLDQYNEWARNGKIHVMPFLDIDMDTGKVEGHEGRHRALALMAEEGSEARMEIAIYLRRKGYKIYYTHPYAEGEDRDKWFIKKYVNATDVPPKWRGQFRATTFHPDLERFNEFYPAKKTVHTAAMQRLTKLYGNPSKPLHISSN